MPVTCGDLLVNDMAMRNDALEGWQHHLDLFQCCFCCSKDDHNVVVLVGSTTTATDIICVASVAGRQPRQDASRRFVLLEAGADRVVLAVMVQQDGKHPFFIANEGKASYRERCSDSRVDGFRRIRTWRSSTKINSLFKVSSREPRGIDCMNHQNNRWVALVRVLVTCSTSRCFCCHHPTLQRNDVGNCSL